MPKPPPTRREKAATARSHSPASTAATSGASRAAEAPRSPSQRRTSRGGGAALSAASAAAVTLAPLPCGRPRLTTWAPAASARSAVPSLGGVVADPERGRREGAAQRRHRRPDPVGLVAGGDDHRQLAPALGSRSSPSPGSFVARPATLEPRARVLSPPMADIEAHITGNVWKIEVAVGDAGLRRRHGRDPRVDEDGDPGRVRRGRRRQGDPLRGGPGGERRRCPRSPGVGAPMNEQLAGGKLELDRPAEAVARLRISNPERRNALDHEILDALAEALPAARPRDRDPLRPDHRRAAGLLRRLRHRDDRRGAPSSATPRRSSPTPSTRRWRRSPSHPWPTVAAINGHCLGGGLELAITCDLRICAAGAQLGMPPAKLGLIYGHTGLRKFLDAIGLARTKELFLTGRNYSASRAERFGLVNEVVDDDRLGHEAVQLAAAIAANAPLSMRGNKSAINLLNALAGTEPAAGGGAGRAARVLLRLRRPARGDPRLRREAAAAVDRRMSAAARERAGRLGPDDGGADRADRRDRPGDAAAAARRRAPRRRLRGAAAGDRRPAALDQGGADDLPARARALRRHHPLARAAAGGERGGPARRRALGPQGRVRARPRPPRARRRARARPPRPSSATSR